jgi:putative ABC transport system permease protein
LPDFGPQDPGHEKQPDVDPAAVATAVEAAAGTGKYYGAATVRATVSGLTGTVDVIVFTGDASWRGYKTVSGRWIDKPGEAVVPTPFLAATGTRIGDTVTLNGLAEPVTVRIVGEALDPRNDGMQVFTDVSTLTSAHPDLTETSHHIAVTPGTDLTGYVDALNRDLAPLGATARAGGLDAGGDMVVTLNALSLILTLMLVAVAALGLLNGVLLEIRERVRELGVHKALGMTPRQTIAMVITSVVVTGLVAGTLGVPLGVALHGWVIPAMGDSGGSASPVPSSPSTTRPSCSRSHSAECSSPPWGRCCPPAGPPGPGPPRPCAPNRRSGSALVPPPPTASSGGGRLEGSLQLARDTGVPACRGSRTGKPPSYFSPISIPPVPGHEPAQGRGSLRRRLGPDAMLERAGHRHWR